MNGETWDDLSTGQQDPAQEPVQESSQEPVQEPPREPYVPASRRKRLVAWIAVFLMVFLVIMYTYSIATGEILKW